MQRPTLHFFIPSFSGLAPNEQEGQGEELPWGHREVSYFGREAIAPSYYKLHKCYKCYIFVLDSP